ncbi:MAG: hypothetical protein JXD21_06885 [Candidatus Omnitrophica bacterium]|nr:hypothetical protein [Candidatus Omnitrophota bacterium]
MFKQVVTYFTLLCFVISTSGCASYQFGRLPSPYVIDHPQSITQNDVSVVAQVMNCDKAVTTFDCEMCEKKIQPVFIVIDNKSDSTYSFAKGDVVSHYLTAEEVAKKCARSTMGRVLSYGFLGLFIITWIIFIPMAIAEAINCPKINSRMRADYADSEIPDATIGPGRSLSGIMFVPQFTSDDKLIIPLVDRATGERLLFRFRDYQMPFRNNEESMKKDKPEVDTSNKTPKSNISF